MNDNTTHDIAAALAAPFPANEVHWRAGSITKDGKRAMALPYLDARASQDRLDEALGLANWQDDYHVLGDGSVACTLRLRIDDEWIAKQDVGSPSEQPAAGDRMKAAYSDSLKRCAVKFGVGRYL